MTMSIYQTRGDNMLMEMLSSGRTIAFAGFFLGKNAEDFPVINGQGAISEDAIFRHHRDYPAGVNEKIYRNHGWR
jgi:hypothetical protein